MADIRREQLRGLAELVLDGYAGVVEQVEATHAELARVPFAVLEAIPVVAIPARGVAVVEGAIRGAVYASLKAAHAVARLAVARALDPIL
jgi:hypothetical protein